MRSRGRMDSWESGGMVRTQSCCHPLIRSFAAFTLVELLVSVAIIAVLLALLLPSLKGAKDRAKAVECMSNLRQISVAVQSYLGDYNGNFIGVYTPNWWDGGQIWWAVLGRAGELGQWKKRLIARVNNL